MFIYWYLHFIVVAALSWSFSHADNGSAQAKIKVEEYLSKWLTSYSMVDSTRLIKKRSIDAKIKTVKFVALNRTFNINLLPTLAQSVTPDMSVVIVGGNNKPTRMNASTFLTEFFFGYIDGDEASNISGYWANNQLVATAHMSDGNILNIEPVSQLTGNLSESRVLVYYESSIKNSQDEARTTCGFRDPPVPPPPLPPSPPPPPPSQSRRHRQRRSATNSSASPSSQQQQQHQQPLVCTLKMVADFAYYRRIGFGQIGATVRSAVKIVDDVNAIYQATDFSDNESTLRILFELASVQVFTEFSDASDHFNAPVDASVQYAASNVLQAFSDYRQNGINFRANCLNHLLTFRRLENSVLGLAYYQTPCAGSYYSTERSTGLAMNTGLTSYSNEDGYPVLFRRGVLVTAHELGHNLGAKHDPDSAECRPPSLAGGSYIMREMSVSGAERNHQKFSPCSLRQIVSYMKTAHKNCLRPPLGGLCGNHRQELDEECDAGLEGDQCCTGNCNLRIGSACSDVNSGCCSGCKVAPRGSICHATSPGSTVRHHYNLVAVTCRHPTRCDGVSAACPNATTTGSSTDAGAPPVVPDGTHCWLGLGRCRAGRCESACRSRDPDGGSDGSEPCDCPNPDDACWLCCSVRGGECVRSGVPVPAKTPCPAGGRCSGNGTCHRPTLDISGPMLAPLFRTGSYATNSMVFIVLVICTALYVPVCLIVRHRDRIRRRGENGNEVVDEEQSAADVDDERDRSSSVISSDTPRQMGTGIRI